MKRVAIYARVSTQDQKTLSMQIEKCSEYARARGWSIVNEIKEVGSGAIPQFNCTTYVIRSAS